MYSNYYKGVIKTLPMFELSNMATILRWKHRSDGFSERDISFPGALVYWTGLGQEFFRRRRPRPQDGRV